MPTDTVNPRPCKVCLVPHDDEIHAATLSVHTWFHDQVTQGFFDYTDNQNPQAQTSVECQVA
jgi:hypothetical protein